jgi:hypothetical protein
MNEGILPAIEMPDLLKAGRSLWPTAAGILTAESDGSAAARHGLCHPAAARVDTEGSGPRPAERKLADLALEAER